MDESNFLEEGGGTRRERRMNWHPAVVPSGRRGKNLQWDAKEEEPVCPKRVSRRHVVRRRQSSPILEVRPSNRQGWWKLSIFRWNGRRLTLDKTVGSREWWHTQGSSGRPASDLGWGSSSKTALGLLSTGSPAGRTPPHGDSSMYSQANVRVGKCAAAPYPSVAVRDRGHWKCVAGSGWVRGETGRGWKGVVSGVHLESRSCEPVRSPNNTSG